MRHILLILAALLTTGCGLRIVRTVDLDFYCKACKCMGKMEMLNAQAKDNGFRTEYRETELEIRDNKGHLSSDTENHLPVKQEQITAY